MVGRKKKTKICDKISHEEDRISQLPDDLICDILYHLSTKDAVRTSVLSTKWRNLWRWVPGLDLSSYTFSNYDAFVSFAQRFFDSHRESWIHKLRLSIHYPYDKSDLTSWIDAVTTRRIQHLDVRFNAFCCGIPTLSIYACKTLVHLLLFRAGLASAEFVSLPCLKIIHLEYVRYPNETMLHKLISGSLVLEDLTIIRSQHDKYKKNVLQVRSHTLKRIHINEYTQVVIDAPLLQSLKTKLTLTKNFQIINSAFPARLDIDSHLRGARSNIESVVRDILTGILRVRDLVISSKTWKEIFQYSKSGSMPKDHIRIFQFRNISHLNAGVYTYNMDTLPLLLESCPKLESLILELVKDLFMRYNNREPKNVMFSTVPRCLVSSLKFVELKRSFSGYERELELVRYFLKNSSILEKFRLVTFDMNKSKFAFLQKLLRNMPRCSSACELDRCSTLCVKIIFGCTDH